MAVPGHVGLVGPPPPPQAFSSMGQEALTSANFWGNPPRVFKGPRLLERLSQQARGESHFPPDWPELPSSQAAAASAYRMVFVLSV